MECCPKNIQKHNFAVGFEQNQHRNIKRIGHRLA